MSNSTKITSSTLRDRLETLIGAYRGPLQADERRLHEAMLEFERTCWGQPVQRAA